MNLILRFDESGCQTPPTTPNEAAKQVYGFARFRPRYLIRITPFHLVLYRGACTSF